MARRASSPGLTVLDVPWQRWDWYASHICEIDVNEMLSLCEIREAELNSNFQSKETS